MKKETVDLKVKVEVDKELSDAIKDFSNRLTRIEERLDKLEEVLKEDFK